MPGCRTPRGIPQLQIRSIRYSGGIFMKTAMTKVAILTFASLLTVGTASATVPLQQWTDGWYTFDDPLTLTKSSVKWIVSPTTHTLTVTFSLVGARPSKLYQVALNFFCSTFPANFGQFPTDGGGGTCASATKQGVTATFAEVEVGVVTTDLHGNGSFKVVIGPVTAGTYDVEFFAHDGAGCELNGGGGIATCAADFQSPGPFGTGTTITIP